MRRCFPVLITLLLTLAAGEFLTVLRSQVKASHPAEVHSIPGYPCYRTISELNTALQQTVSEHPQIAQLETIGPSNEGRPLQVIRLTNIAIAGPKPIFFLLGNIHSREVITPEAAMAFVNYLTDLYGIDADVTWLLDQHDIRVLISANPDGHVQVEQGEAYSWWQKNTHAYMSPCSPPGPDFYPGVDLNQNFSFHWAGLSRFINSSNACDETYHGPGAASEPETQAVQNYLFDIFTDYRPPADDDPAFEDAEGIAISLQSPGERVLWPWAWTTTPAPNASVLILLGQKLAGLNGYTAQQASAQGYEGGTPIDWPYGELGIASFALEIGPQAGGYYPACEEANAIIQSSLPALVYAAKVARTPYLTSQGPDAFNIRIEQSGQSWSLKAVLSDSANGGDPITAAEYYIDSVPWNGGQSYGLLADDGTFDEVTEPASGSFPANELTPGKHLILVRGRDSSGNWGAPSAIFYTTIADSTIAGFVSVSGSEQPIQGAEISFEGVDMTAYAVTDELGQYSTAVLHGVYTATVTASGYSPWIEPNITAEAGQTTDQDFSLSPLPYEPGAIAGVVRDQGSNLPLAARIDLASTPYWATSDQGSGYYILENVPPGMYTLTASASGYLTATIQVSVVSGHTTPQDIDLASLSPGPDDLRLSLEGPEQPAFPGGQYQYTVQIENLSAVPLTHVSVNATLPAEVDFVSASPLAFEQGGAVSWILPTLNVESIVYLRFIVQVKTETLVGTMIHMDQYSASANEIPGVVVGSNPVDVLVRGRLFLPFVRAK